METCLVIAKFPGIAHNAPDVFLDSGDVRIEYSPPSTPFSPAMHIDGTARPSPAKLNYGDCMVYAMAKALDEPLLYKSDDSRRQM